MSLDTLAPGLSPGIRTMAKIAYLKFGREALTIREAPQAGKPPVFRAQVRFSRPSAYGDARTAWVYPTPECAALVPASGGLLRTCANKVFHWTEETIIPAFQCTECRRRFIVYVRGEHELASSLAVHAREQARDQQVSTYEALYAGRDLAAFQVAEVLQIAETDVIALSEQGSIPAPIPEHLPRRLWAAASIQPLVRSSPAALAAQARVVTPY